MREVVGPVAVNLLFLFAGLGICAGLGVAGPSLRSWAVTAGLAYMSGVAATGLALVTALTVGVALTSVTLAVTAVAIGAAGLAYARVRGRARSPAISTGRVRGRLDSAVIAVFALVLSVYGLLGLRKSLVTSLDVWDGWAFWTKKAIALVNFGGLETDLFAGRAYSVMHLDYPLLLPALEAVFFRAAGVVDTQAVHAQLWLLLIGFAWAAAAVLNRATRPVIWVPVVLAAVLAPAVSQQLLTGYADVPMALFVGLGAILLGGWLRDREPWQIVLATLMLAAAANTKNEGFVAAVALLVAATAVLVAQRSWRRVAAMLGAWAGLGLAVLPWRLWLAAHDLSSDLPVAKGLDPGYLTDRADRVGPSLRALRHEIFDPGQWMLLVPIAAAIALLVLLSRGARRVSAFYVLSGTLVFASLVWAYWISPYELGWHLRTSADRVVAVLFFIAVAALGQVAATLERDLRD